MPPIVQSPAKEKGAASGGGGPTVTGEGSGAEAGRNASAWQAGVGRAGPLTRQVSSGGSALPRRALVGGHVRRSLMVHRARYVSLRWVVSGKSEGRSSNGESQAKNSNSSYELLTHYSTPKIRPPMRGVLRNRTRRFGPIPCLFAGRKMDIIPRRDNCCDVSNSYARMYGGQLKAPRPSRPGWSGQPDYQPKALRPVWARPRIRAWTSCVPS